MELLACDSSISSLCCCFVPSWLRANAQRPPNSNANSTGSIDRSSRLSLRCQRIPEVLPRQGRCTSRLDRSIPISPKGMSEPRIGIITYLTTAQNHTITESSFDTPCKPLAANLTSATRPGLKSGFVPVTGQEPFTPVYNVLINDTKPIWIYCGQVNHCQKGMAMVINQNDTSPKTIEAYIAAAAALPVANVTAPPPAAGAPPPAYGGGAPPPAAPAATSSTPPPFGFGGSPPAAASTSSSFVPPPAVATITPSSVGVAPATFTGAAVHGYVPQSSTGVVGLVLGALLALW